MTAVFDSLFVFIFNWHSFFGTHYSLSLIFHHNFLPNIIYGTPNGYFPCHLFLVCCLNLTKFRWLMVNVNDEIVLYTIERSMVVFAPSSLLHSIVQKEWANDLLIDFARFKIVIINYKLREQYNLIFIEYSKWSTKKTIRTGDILSSSSNTLAERLKEFFFHMCTTCMICSARYWPSRS